MEKLYTRPGADCGLDYELLIAKFRLKLKKVGKTTRLFKRKKVKSLSRVRLFVTPWTGVTGGPGSSIHGIFQASVLEWVAISFSRGSSRPRD